LTDIKAEQEVHKKSMQELIRHKDNLITLQESKISDLIKMIDSVKNNKNVEITKEINNLNKTIETMQKTN